MAVGKRRSDAPRTSRRSFGSFTLSGGEDVVRLTITKDLDGYEFPNDRGEEVRVELVDEPEREPYLEIHPMEGGDS